jgi:hypothetical protein
MTVAKRRVILVIYGDAVVSFTGNELWRAKEKSNKSYQGVQVQEGSMIILLTRAQTKEIKWKETGKINQMTTNILKATGRISEREWTIAAVSIKRNDITWETHSLPIYN